MQKSILYVAIVGMLAATLALGTWTEHRPIESLQRPLQQIPEQLDNWRLVKEQRLTASVENQLKASSYISRTYTNGSTSVDLFIAYYAVQHAGESMHSPKHCLPGAGWDISHHEILNMLVNSRTAAVNRYDIQNGTSHAVALYWYQSMNRIVASEYTAKLLFAYDAIVNSRTAGSIVRIICSDDPKSVPAAEHFARLIIPEMQQCLGRH